VALPSGDPGIGFDDLRYSPTLHRVLVPAGRTGTLDLVDPDTLAVTSIPGFGTVASYFGGHDDGPTSVDEGNGVLYVTDRTTGKLDVVDPAAGRIISAVALGAGPDYVRFVKASNELWVTEPDAEQIEIFTLAADPTVAPVHAAVVGVTNGPESLVIDNTRGRAYTHRWQATTVAIDLASRTIVAEWQNGCAASRGIALDEARGFLFAACSEGTTSVLDVKNAGTILSTMAKGSGFDVMGYAPQTGHLYLAGSSCGCLVTLGVSAQGALSFISRVDASSSTHCAVGDDAGHAWWCDQDRGSVWRVPDKTPATF
jgi:DNA-binding beta-propeller fold protein YncE